MTIEDLEKEFKELNEKSNSLNLDIKMVNLIINRGNISFKVDASLNDDSSSSSKLSDSGFDYITKCIECSLKILCPRYNCVNIPCPDKTEKKVIRLNIKLFLLDNNSNKIKTISKKRLISSVSMYDLCLRCKDNKELSDHHIIPRKYDGGDFKENRVCLCKDCHDYVEIKTEEWITSGKHYNIDILRSLIINDGFDW